MKKSIIFVFISIMSGMICLQAQTLHVGQEGNTTVGFTDNGDMIMVQSNESGQAAGVTLVKNDNESTPAVIPARTEAPSGVIGWADYLLETVSNNYGKDINTFVETVDNALFLKSLKNAKTDVEFAGVIAEKQIETYGNIKDLMEWVKAKSGGGGWFVGKTLLKLVGSYTQWRDKWAQICYDILINLDEDRNKQVPVPSKEEQDNWVSNEVIRMNELMQNGGKKPTPPQEPEEPEQPVYEGTTQVEATLNISGKHLLDPLTEAELQQVKKNAGDEVEMMIRCWVNNIPKIKKAESAECQKRLMALTYNDLGAFCRGFWEILALQTVGLDMGVVKGTTKLEEVSSKLIVLKQEFLRLYAAKDPKLVEHLNEYLMHLEICQVIHKYELEKYIFF